MFFASSTGDTFISQGRVIQFLLAVSPIPLAVTKC